MTQREYDHKKRECFNGFCKRYRIEEPSEQNIESFDWIFDRAYTLGKETETITQEEIEKASLKYILNRQQAKHDAKREEEASLSDFDNTLKAWDAFDMAQAYEDGANFALGKQENDAGKEEMFTCEKSKVLYRFRMAEACKKGNNPETDYWIGYSKAIQDLFGLEGEPYVTPNDADTVIQGWVCRDEDNTLTLFYRSNKPSKEDGDDYWSVVYGNALEYLNQNLFPDLTWDSDPEPVEITIKRKKNGNNSTDNRI